MEGLPLPPAFILGRRIVFDVTTATLRGVEKSENCIELDHVSCQVLLQFAISPQILLRADALIQRTALESGKHESPAARLRYVVDALRRSLRALDPSTTYIVKIPRLGYVLATSAVQTCYPSNQ